MAMARRTQAERTASTRGLLLDAAIDCLIERGYAATTTTEVAQRAGVSRGAQLHHFPTKAELLVSAVEHLFERRRDEFRKAIADMPTGADSIDTAVDFLWSIISGASFSAWIELTVAARTDPELAQAMADVDQRFFDENLVVFKEMFPASAAGGVADVALAFTFSVLDGLALQSMGNRDHPLVPQVLDTLKALAHLALPNEE